MSGRRRIMVVGFPRSGTSWWPRASFAPGFTYYFEPDNYHHVPEAEKRFTCLYLTAEHDDPAYRRLMIRACAGEMATAFTMNQHSHVDRCAVRLLHATSLDSSL